MKKFFRGVLILAALLIILPCTTAYAADGRKIAKGIRVGSIDVSGMTVTDAQNAIDEYVEKLRAGHLSLSAGDKEVTVSGEELGITWDNRQVIDEAYSLGHSGNIVNRYKALKDLEHEGHSFDIKLGFDDEQLKDIVENRCSSFNKEKINFGLKKTENGFEISDGQTGLIIDESQSIQVIKDFVQGNWDGENAKVELSVKEDKPLGDREALSKVKDVLGTYTTSYKTSGASRSANVANGCRLINGTTLYPGDEFSVLDVITPFTEANGYFPAGSYLNGVVVESIGGGICQVSTTLYNAVLLAELEVTERHCHSMIVTYVSPSADAAIAESGGKNFKFVNSTENPIYIEGTTTPDKHITFTIYGVETRPSTHQVAFKSEVLETTPASEDKFVTDASQAIGYVGTQSAHIGYKAQLRKVVTDNGTVTSDEVVNNSVYKMVPKIITVGTAGADATTMAQLNAAIATKDVGTVKAVAAAISAARNAAGTDGAEAAAQAAADAVNAANAQLQQQAEAAAQVAQAAEQDDGSETIQTN